MNRKDWSAVSIEDVDYERAELVKQLNPALHISKERYSPQEYGTQLVDECRNALSVVLPFTNAEKAFLDLLLEKGEIDAATLTSDPALQKHITAQPNLNGRRKK